MKLKQNQAVRNFPYLFVLLLILAYTLANYFHVLQYMSFNVHFTELGYFHVFLSLFYFLFHANTLHLINNLILLSAASLMLNLAPFKTYISSEIQVRVIGISAIIGAIIFKITYTLGFHEQTVYLIGASGGVYALVSFALTRVLLSLKTFLHLKYVLFIAIFIIYLSDQIKMDVATAGSGSIFVHGTGYLIGCMYGIWVHVKNK